MRSRHDLPRSAGISRRGSRWRSGLPVILAGFASAAVASAAFGQVPVLPEGNAPDLGVGIGAVPDTRVATVAAPERVKLTRHSGKVNGDGMTIYVANRTEFRPRRAMVALPPRLRARSWVVIDLDTGRLLGKHAARLPHRQASTMKLLTALTALRTVPVGARHRVTRFEASQICSCAGLRRGFRYRRDTLLTGMLLPSGNDAAEALAGSHPRGRTAFYQAMNRTARRLGATETVARNASGLTARGSHSSARDLVLLLRAASAKPAVARILAMRSAVIATGRGWDRHTVWRGTDYVNRFPGSLGKSGWTTPSKSTLVVATNVNGHRVGVATMGSPPSYSTSGARSLTMWASNNFAGLRAVGKLPHS